MKKRTTLRHILTAIILALSLAVALPITMSVDAVGAKLNKTKVTVCTGKTYTLKMSGISKTVKWSTSDTKVVSISKKSGKLSEKCTIKANKKGTATVTAKVKVGKKTKTFKCKVTVKGHSYGDATYQWSSDKSKCTATKECTRCHKKLSQTVKTSKKTTKKATCTEKGKRTYTAKFTKYDFGTKTKNVSIKALGHAFDKVSYKWNASYSACTAKAVCSRCNASVSEKATVTSKVTKQATKSATGVRTYTATFTNKDFSTQTKNVTIPKVAYLEKEAIIIDYNNPMDVRVCNDTIDTIRFFDVSGKEVDGYNNVILYKIYGTISEDKTSIYFSTGYKTEENTLVAKITTTRGQVLSCRVSTKFVPGEYKFGKISTLPSPSGYRGYGKLKGTYGDGAYDYIVDCNTKAEYDAAYDYFHNQTGPYGKCNLDTKAAWINNACSERSLYYNQYMDALIAQYGSVGQIYASCDDELYNYLILTSADSTGFNGIVESQSQVDFIVTAWANKYNNGELPSWYYPTVFSDWAEWSGADVGLNTESYYEFRGIN